jgi:glutathione S-transferase
MKLHFAPTSPFARKALMTALETGTAGKLEIVATNPWEQPDALTRNNPLSRIPVLVTDDGLALFDSPVICEYLDSLNEGEKLFPPPGNPRWIALKQQALADGICDAGILSVVEHLRKETTDEAWSKRQLAHVKRALGELEREVDDLEGPVTIGQVATACALGYVDLRELCDGWREDCPRLAGWFAKFSERPSFQKTIPPAP